MNTRNRFKQTLALGALVVSLATPSSTGARRVSGPSASGSYKVVLEDGFAKQVEFEATWDERGTTTGRMTFRDEAPIVEPDIDGPADSANEPSSEFYIAADLDSLTIDNNRALMGGTVRESSHKSYIGKWVQLVVEDNGEGTEVPDKLTWCFCRPEPGGWTPVDAEVRGDEGVWMHWWSTDAEREEDRGVQSANLIPGNRTGCPTFALSTYKFPDEKGAGQIQVLPSR